MRSTIKNNGISSVIVNIDEFFKEKDSVAKPFIIILLTVLFIVAVMSTILMYMNYFVLDNPNLEKRIIRDLNKEVRELNKQSKKRNK
ncbi:hypothetical protein JXB41_08540 [Candidatus Woesearchaeota archaeon]|nr:hypothetical protein [Candidatus Woesearchaeota archaeon]